MENVNLLKDKNKEGFQWFVVTTKYQHEKKVDQLLKGKGHNSYLPLYNKLSYWKDRKKKIQTPLFHCYLFVNINPKTKMDILQTNGVIHFVSFDNKPVPIPDCQIELIKNLLNEDRKIEAEFKFVEGQQVKVVYGPLKGAVGVFQKVKDKSRLLITLETLNRTIAVEINADEIVPVT